METRYVLHDPLTASLTGSLSLAEYDKILEDIADTDVVKWAFPKSWRHWSDLTVLQRAVVSPQGCYQVQS